jgi:hypothetical protein
MKKYEEEQNKVKQLEIKQQRQKLLFAQLQQQRHNLQQQLTQRRVLFERHTQSQAQREEQLQLRIDLLQQECNLHRAVHLNLSGLHEDLAQKNQQLLRGQAYEQQQFNNINSSPVAASTSPSPAQQSPSPVVAASPCSKPGTARYQKIWL